MATIKVDDLELPAVAITYLRDMKGWTYDDIAHRCECNKTTIWRAHTQGSELREYTARRLTNIAQRTWRAMQKKKRK